MKCHRDGELRTKGRDSAYHARNNVRVIKSSKRREKTKIHRKCKLKRKRLFAGPQSKRTVKWENYVQY